MAALLAIALFAVAPASTHAQVGTADQIAARDEFRWGVTALHDGRINEAIASLTRSIALDSEQPLVRYWLGRAFYYAGFEQEALLEWRWVRDRNRTSVLDRWIERVELERGLTRERLGDDIVPGRYVTMVELTGIQGDSVLFRRPAMVRPRPDGFFYLANFGANSVVLFDPNGVRRRVIDGGLEGLDRPFDVHVRGDGSLLVSEFGADRIAIISAQGLKTGSFGSRGIRSGGLLGPQYIDGDADFVYVSDHGNARIAKFRHDGTFLFSFGSRSTTFDGLRSPAGVVVEADRIYVADTDAGRIAVFDDSGNFLRALTNPAMTAPEGLSLYEPGRLVVSDRNRLYIIDVVGERVFPIAEFTDRRRIIGAALDANRNLLASDMASNSVLFLSASEELYTGVTIEIESVNALRHPEILVHVAVTDRNGLPLIGLDENNFRVTEDRLATGVFSVTRAGDGLPGGVAIVADRSATMVEHQDDLEAAAIAIVDSLRPTDTLSIVSAGADPVVELQPGSGRLQVASAARGTPAQYGDGRLDNAIRLAGTQINRELGPRTIVVVTDGAEHPSAFERFSIEETARFLANNDIRLLVVYTRRNTTNRELDYLATSTGGSSVYLYAAAGVGAPVQAITRRSSGRYVLRYRSVHDTDFGRRFIPVEIEVYLLDRSGRDESGYFGSLVF